MKRILYFLLWVCIVCCSCEKTEKPSSGSMRKVAKMNVADAVCVVVGPPTLVDTIGASVNDGWILYKVMENGSIQPVTYYDKYGQTIEDRTMWPSVVHSIRNTPYICITYAPYSNLYVLVNTETEAAYISPIEIKDATLDASGNMYFVKREDGGNNRVVKIDLTDPDNVTMKNISVLSDKYATLRAVSADGDVAYVCQTNTVELLYRIKARNGRVNSILPPGNGCVFTGLDGKIHMFYDWYWITYTIREDGTYQEEYTMVPEYYHVEKSETDEIKGSLGNNTYVIAPFKDRILCLYPWNGNLVIADSENKEEITGAIIPYTEAAFPIFKSACVTDNYFYCFTEVLNNYESTGVYHIDRLNPHTLQNTSMLECTYRNFRLAQQNGITYDLSSYIVTPKDVIIFVGTEAATEMDVLGKITPDGQVEILDRGKGYIHLELDEYYFL